MPYVEGFGTYPFGEEWLFDAVIRSYVPVCELAERLTITVTPVLADQLEAEGVAERLERFLRRFRIESCEADVADVDEPYREACRGRGAALPPCARADPSARRRPGRAVRRAVARGRGSSWSPRRRLTPSCR